MGKVKLHQYGYQSRRYTNVRLLSEHLPGRLERRLRRRMMDRTAGRFCLRGNRIAVHARPTEAKAPLTARLMARTTYLLKVLVSWMNKESEVWQTTFCRLHWSHALRGRPDMRLCRHKFRKRLSTREHESCEIRGRMEHGVYGYYLPVDEAGDWGVIEARRRTTRAPVGDQAR